MNVLIVGRGRVALALEQVLLSQRGSHKGNVRFFGSQDDSSKLKGLIDWSDVVCLAIPTTRDGAVAYGYIRTILERDKPVVTCEKGALSNYFSELSPYLSRIGSLATVGGGSGMLDLFKIPTIQIRKITGIVNATLNFLFSRVAQGETVATALEEAGRFGLCEPGVQNLAGVFNAELADIAHKAVIVHNLAFRSVPPLSMRDVGFAIVGEQTARELLLKKAYTHRFMVTIGSRPVLIQTFPSLCVCRGGIYVCGGLELVEDSDFRLRSPLDAFCALAVDTVTGPIYWEGVGAGPTPTAGAMFVDIKRLLFG